MVSIKIKMNSTLRELSRDYIANTWGGGITRDAQDLLRALYSGITPGETWETIWNVEVESQLATCEARAPLRELLLCPTL